MRDLLKHLKVGDRVWISEGKKRTLHTVVRLTPKQVVVDWPWGDSTRRFQRAKPPSYPHLDDRCTYYQIGNTGWDLVEIRRVATPDECIKWDADQKAAAEEAVKVSEERKQRELLRDGLSALFGRRMVSVSESHHNSSAKWNVQLYLTEDGVRTLAQLINQLTPEQLPSWES